MILSRDAYLATTAALLAFCASNAGAQEQARGEEAFKVCVIGALPKFDDGTASPESIFLAARLECDREEGLLLEAIANDFEAKFKDLKGEARNDYVFGLRDVVMQDTVEGVAAIVLMQRVADRRKAQ